MKGVQRGERNGEMVKKEKGKEGIDRGKERGGGERKRWWWERGGRVERRRDRKAE